MKLIPLNKKKVWIVWFNNPEGKTFQGTYTGLNRDLSKIEKSLPEGSRVLKIVKKIKMRKVGG